MQDATSGLVRISSSLNRRGFLGACAGCLAGAVCPRRAEAAPIPMPPDKAKVKLVFSHIPAEKPTWPYQGYNYEGRKKELTAKLTAACPNIEFLPVTVHSADEGKQLLASGEEVDGYLVYMIGIWVGAGYAIASAGKPALFVDDLYAGSGEFLTAYARARRQGLKVAGVSSSRFEDVVQGARTFEAIRKLRSSVMLDITNRDPGANGKAIEEVFGTKVLKITGKQVEAAYNKADRAEGKDWASKWIKGARKVVEPSREEIDKSGAMYVAMRDLMVEHKAQATAIDCLNLFYGGNLSAYPCLGLFQLNNDGFVGACEADLQSAITMLAISYLTGRPGYISDPVIDTSKNQIIYAHCVAPSKVYGPAGRSNPYIIRDHSEDRKGASIESLMPLGDMTTTLRFNPQTKEVVFHQGKAVGHISEDKACRTKLAVEVKDPIKLLDEWDRWGWHRVTFYGDLRAPVEALAGLAGFKMIYEG